MHFLALMLVCATAQAAWRQTLDARIPLYGHRNWIVVADSAYPLQSGAGIETIRSDKGQAETVAYVLGALAKVKHVRPVIHTDNELPFVPEKDAPGIDSFRRALAGIFGTRKPEPMPHEDIIRKLDEAGKTFSVLIIKTDMTLPYTSVFLELRAAYWSDEAEDRLRKLMK